MRCLSVACPLGLVYIYFETCSTPIKTNNTHYIFLVNSMFKRQECTILQSFAICILTGGFYPLHLVIFQVRETKSGQLFWAGQQLYQDIIHVPNNLPTKIHDSATFSIVTELCNHHRYQFVKRRLDQKDSGMPRNDETSFGSSQGSQHCCGVRRRPHSRTCLVGCHCVMTVPNGLLWFPLTT